MLLQKKIKALCLFLPVFYLIDVSVDNPNPEPDMAKIKSQAEKYLETIKLVENNNRKYSFRDKESKKRFSNLLK